jgi:hypothetical protein
MQSPKQKRGAEFSKSSFFMLSIDHPSSKSIAKYLYQAHYHQKP